MKLATALLASILSLSTLAVQGAARRVCEEQANDQQVNQTYPVCVKGAVSAAVARIDHPMLSDYVAQAEPATVAAR
jgi:hypothetical protein